MSKWLVDFSQLVDQKFNRWSKVILGECVFSYGQMNVYHNAFEIFHAMNQTIWIPTKQHIMTM